MADLTTIKNWFKTGLKPTERQFSDTWDSFRHISENIPANQVEGLSTLLNVKSNVGHTHPVTDIIGLQPQSQDLRSVLNKGREGDYMYLNENQLGMFNSNNVVYGHDLKDGGFGNAVVYLGTFMDNADEFRNIITLGAHEEVPPRADNQHQLVINTNGNDIIFNTDVRSKMAFDLPLASGRLALEKGYATLSFVAEQFGHEAPSMTILTNELGLPEEAFRWTYVSLGQYSMNCERPIFTPDTFIFISKNANSSYDVTARVQNEESIGFMSLKNGKPEDDGLNRSFMTEIRFYRFEQIE